MGWVRELYRRQPVYAVLGFFILAAVPFYLIMMLIDSRQVDEISVWLKPTKFGVSLGLFSLTLAFFTPWMRPGAIRTVGHQIIVWLFAVSLVFEFLWLLSAGILGIRSHFNIDGGLFTILYPLSGLAAFFLVLAAMFMGVSVLKARKDAANPALAEAIGWGLVLTFVLTPMFGFILSSPMGEFGGSKYGYGDGIFGWRMPGGDLRAVHFLATHALHVLPAFGFIVSLVFRQGIGVWLNRLMALGYASVVVWLGLSIVMYGADLPEILRSPF